uniref:Putative structural protein n=1 Tax=viral metagenome TaxID=1070528 RepID=A0A6M3KU21_9ZZZZ
MVQIPKLEYNEIVEVLWWDANSDSSWRGEETVKKEKPTVCHTIGYYTACTKDSLILSPDYNDGKDRSTVLIPRGMIKKIWRFERD